MDIGCGTGQSTEHLLSHFEKVYGCDPSQAMLDQAKEDYKNHGIFTTINKKNIILNLKKTKEILEQSQLFEFHRAKWVI